MTTETTSYMDTVTTFDCSYACRHGRRPVQSTPRAWHAGGMVAAQRENCPRCAAATAARAAVDATMAPVERRMVARYAGHCRVCGQAVRAGYEVIWARDLGVRHFDCTPAAGAAETGCAVCGAEGDLMTSSTRGAVCAECYDRIEARS